jgi:hypothetical protein
MQTLKIEIPVGYEIDSFDKSTGDIKFKPKPKKVTERIKTVSDVLADNGITQSQFDKECQYLSGHEVAYRILHLLAKSLNEGWTPDWSNSGQYKYVPWFDFSSGFRFDVDAYWSSRSTVGSRLCFKTSELAEYAGKQFLDVYRKFMVIE